MDTFVLGGCLHLCPECTSLLASVEYSRPGGQTSHVAWSILSPESECLMSGQISDLILGKRELDPSRHRIHKEFETFHLQIQYALHSCPVQASYYCGAYNILVTSIPTVVVLIAVMCCQAAAVTSPGRSFLPAYHILFA